MNNLIEIGNGLHGILVPIEAENSTIEKLYIFSDANKQFGIIFNENTKLGVIPIESSDYEILGTASLTKITFDCEPYVEKYYFDRYRNYEVDVRMQFEKVIKYSDKQSFYSLLKSKGLSPNDNFKVLILKTNK